ncbi:MAG: DUF4437 domain-containing protein [Rhodospirillaceae bacterium]|nr:DUF4437 domain-containing protein [Rhodospirillaceae bacterium]
MPRPHIEFVQAQALPWRDGLASGDRPGAYSKTLSADENSGATSILIGYPPGWSWGAGGPGIGHVRADEEFLVLDGALDIDGRRYGKYAYGLLPAGFAREAMSAPDGAVVVTFFSAPAVAARGASNGHDPRKLVAYIDALNAPYKNEWARMGSADVNVNGISMKLLREDPDTRDQTWLLGAVAGWPGGAFEIHPVVEEMYLISGEIIGPFGHMRTGAYFWRPPGLRHGPFGTARPTLHLFRTEGGPLSTVFEPPGQPWDWQVPFSPILPPDMAHLTAHEYAGPLDHWGVRPKAAA